MGLESVKLFLTSQKTDYIIYTVCDLREVEHIFKSLPGVAPNTAPGIFIRKLEYDTYRNHRTNQYTAIP